MTTSTRARPRVCRRIRRGDDGRVSVFLAVAFLAAIVIIGLAVDGGGRYRTAARATNLAAEAARTGGQAINVPQAVTGRDKVVDPQRAVRAAEAYLATAGVTGTAAIDPDGRHLTVTVTVAYRTVLLGAIGIPEITVTAHATAELVTG